MQEIKDKVQQHFDSNPELKELFGTKDGFLFYKEADAQNHAFSLDQENPEVEAFFRNEIEAKANIETKKEKEVKTESETEKEEKVEKPKKK